MDHPSHPQSGKLDGGNGVGELGAKLLANALLERGRVVNDRKGREAATAESQRRMEGLQRLLGAEQAL